MEEIDYANLEFDAEFPVADPDIGFVFLAGNTFRDEVIASNAASMRGRAAKKARLAAEQAERERAERERPAS